MVEVLRDILDNLDELIVAVVAASSGGFIGGWMALRAARTSIDRSVAAGREERQAAARERRRSALVALEAELRLNAALMASEQGGQFPVAPAWRIPFRDGYVAALPYLAGLPASTRAALQDAAVLSSHYTVIANQVNGHLAGRPDPQAAQAGDDRLRAMAPDVSARYLQAADELRDALDASAISPSPDDGMTA